jgi:polysaccharide export outer membrane protein
MNTPGTGLSRLWALVVGVSLLLPAAAPLTAFAQARTGTNGTTTGAAIVAPPDYVIGADDVLSVVFWREKELSGDVTVRPDGKISLPLLNDIMAAGLTPEQLREQVSKRAASFVQDPQATVVVKTINSRKVFITGQVEKPGSYLLTTRLSVMQLIAMAGGLREYAKSDRIVVMRLEQGREVRYRFDYDKVLEGKETAQNLDLKPGDTVVVP